MTAPLLLAAMTAAQFAPPGEPPAPAFAPPNLPLPTLGGMQFWGDVRCRAGWRVQRHVVTGHHRLLDPGDVRRAWGERANCDAALAAAVRDRDLPRPAGDVVLLLHGMVRSGRCFAPLAADLKSAGFAAIAVDYPSTRQSLRAAAAALEEITDGLLRDQDPTDPVRLHFVCHSAGGLVVRAWTELQGNDVPVGRTVLLGVPNAGAAMADAVRGVPLIGSSLDLLWGTAAGEISTDPGSTLASLPAPRGEFATIAGCRGTAGGFNPLIPGDDDGTVGVAEARLNGEVDHLAVPGAAHSFLMTNPTVRAATVRFLRGGRLGDDNGAAPHDAR